MSLRKLSSLAAGLVLAFGTLGPAHALLVGTSDYKIIFDNYDSGSVYYTGLSGGSAAGPNTNGLKCGGLGGGAVNIASCNAAATLVGGNASASVGSVNTSADTMGIISVAAITRISDGATLFTRGTATSIGGVAVGPFLTGVFGNLTDYLADTASCFTTGCRTTTFATGGTFKLWSNTTDYDPTVGPMVSANVDLNALKYAPSISSGMLFLGGVFAIGGATSTDTAASYVSSFLDSTITGDGVGFLDFNAGSALSVFDTNGQLTNNLSGTQFADAKLSSTFFPSAAATASGWTVFSSGQVTGTIVQVPEPGSLALAALALLALGVSAKRKKAS